MISNLQSGREPGHKAMMSLDPSSPGKWFSTEFIDSTHSLAQSLGQLTEMVVRGAPAISWAGLCLPPAPQLCGVGKAAAELV